MTLEPATPFHAEAMALLHARAFPPGERWGADAMALQLGQPGAFGFVALEGGMILARVAADEAEVLTLAVDPIARRRGIGRALVLGVLAEAARRGASALLLEVAETNRAACALYAQLGLQPVGRRRAYYRGGVDALILRGPCGSAGG